MSKSEKIILVIVGIVVLIAIIYFMVFSGKPKFTYYLKTGVSKQTTNMLINNYSEFEKFIATTNISGDVTNQNDFLKKDIMELFNSEYFENKKVAVVVTFEITTNSYIYSIDNVKYSSDKSSATVYYTDKKGEYVGPKMNSWYNYMFVELDGNVSTVDFEKTTN